MCLVASGALYLSGISGGLLVASGKGGVRRGFSILEFPPWILDYPNGAVRRSIGRQKAAVWGYWFASDISGRSLLQT